VFSTSISGLRTGVVSVSWTAAVVALSSVGQPSTGGSECAIRSSF
jgi:hypothetical protein